MKLTRFEFNNLRDFTTVTSRLSGQGRWSVWTEIVIKNELDGTFWRGEYEEGATEMQEGDYDDDDIEFDQVWPVTGLMTFYRTAKELADEQAILEKGSPA